MPMEFEFQDMSGSEFWGVDLHGSTFRDVDLSGVRVSHARLVDVDIDGLVDRVVINGVDVTEHVNAGDPWYPLRSQLRPTDLDDARRGWAAFVQAWADVIDRGRRLGGDAQRASVDGEWSLAQTIRHLVFATDKWFTVPVAGGDFHPIGLPNSGSVDFGWPGIDPSADPGFEDAVGVWRDRLEGMRAHLEAVDPGALDVEVEVLENGPTTVHECIGVVFEEHFHHLRYAVRDLDRLGSPDG